MGQQDRAAAAAPPARLAPPARHSRLAPAAHPARRTRLAPAAAALGVAAACAIGSLAVPGSRPATSGPPVRLVTAVAAAQPSAPDFGSWLDARPRYEAESGCSPVATAGALDVVRILANTYGTGYATNIVRTCSARRSGHEEGRAIDWMTNSRVPAARADAQAFVGWLLADEPGGRSDVMARRLGIMYVIWDSRFYPVYASAPVWEEYSDCLTVRTSAADDTYCHRNHVHLSMTWAGARRQTSWWTLAGGAPPCADPTRAVPGLALAAAEPPVLAAVTRTAALDTEVGIGTPRVPLPCRVQARSRLTAHVLGRGAVPASGVAAVRVEVVASGAAASTWVSLSPLGGRAAPAAQRLTVPAGTTARRTLTVPVGRAGAISVDVGPAAAALRLDVLGYLPAAGTGTARGAP